MLANRELNRLGLARMNAKPIRLASFAFATVAALFLSAAAQAGTRLCAEAAASCSAPAGPGKVANERIQIAQVPAMTGKTSKVIIEQPKQDIPRKAFKVLETHCARCHQQGRLKRAKPAKDFGNILQLDEIAGDPHLILPGNPDGSRLFSRIVKQEMPYDVYTEFSGGSEPSKEDVQAIYDWIESLNPKTVATCSDRTPIDTGEVVSAISADLKTRNAGRRKDMRYLSLANWYNACASNEELRRMRNGTTLLLNSLSRAPRTTRPSVIGKSGSIVAFNLDDLGWSPEDWNTLAAAYPYGARPKSPTFDQIKSTTNAPLPYLRADWFAAAASRPPLYYNLLDLPENLTDLQSQLGVDAQRNRTNGDVMRAGVESSVISRFNRIVERHATANGYLWMTYDFDGSDTDQRINSRPLGPGDDSGFDHDLNAALFSLPNGMNAFYLGNDNGERADGAPPDILYDDSHPRQPVIAGLSCISCHARGVRDALDTVRARAQSGGRFSAADKEQILRMYVPQKELDRRIKDDRKRYSNAAASAGIRAETGDDGLDDLTYLVRAYEKQLDLRIAAAEYGVTSAQYGAGMSKAGGDAQRTKQELEQGTIARQKFEPLFRKHVATVSNDVPAGRITAPKKRPAKPPLAAANQAPAKQKKKVAAKPKKVSPPPVQNVTPPKKEKVAAVSPEKPAAAEVDETITLVSDKARYRANDLPVFTVRASTDCRLTLINVDPKGKATVIFPNKYQQQNFIEARKDFRFPGADAPFQFRLKDIGKEKLVAECAINRAGERIQHNFEQQEFTDLGDYRDHLGEQAEKEGGKTSAGATKAKLLRTAITFSVQ
jgi:mono/diheme cytochrome c family protein